MFSFRSSNELSPPYSLLNPLTQTLQRVKGLEQQSHYDRYNSQPKITGESRIPISFLLLEDSGVPYTHHHNGQTSHYDGTIPLKRIHCSFLLSKIIG